MRAILMTDSPDQNHNAYTAASQVPDRHVLEQALGGLSQAATGLGANTVAVLALGAASVEIVFRRAEGHNLPPASLLCAAELRIALEDSSGAATAGTSTARHISTALAPRSRSFLLFPWPAPRAKIAILFGFESAEPTCASVPAHLLDTLNLASAAAWLFSELSHLHEELRRANHRFAGRKLVERAKGILQNERGMTEQEAYEYLRRMSRQRRITLSTLAENLLSASHWP